MGTNKIGKACQGAACPITSKSLHWAGQHKLHCQPGNGTLVQTSNNLSDTDWTGIYFTVYCATPQKEE